LISREEEEKAQFLYGLLGTEEEIMITVIVMGTPIPFGLFQLAVVSGVAKNNMPLTSHDVIFMK